MARLLEGCHIKSQSFCGLSPSHLSQRRMENIWVCFGTVPFLPLTDTKSRAQSLLAAERGKIILHRAQQC